MSEFLDNDVRIHEQDLHYTGRVPIPAVGDVVNLLETGGWVIASRNYYYWDAEGQKKIKVSLQVKQMQG